MKPLLVVLGLVAAVALVYYKRGAVLVATGKVYQVGGRLLKEFTGVTVPAMVR